MLGFLRRAYAVCRAYVLTDLVRGKGFVFSLIGMSMWMMLFMPSVALFIDPSADPGTVAGYGLAAMLVFLFYSVATWDWAAELRWMINDGRLEYYMASGSGFAAHYLGVMPVSLMWIALALGVNYAVLSAVWGPPSLSVRSPAALLCGLALMVLNLLAYALVLGGAMLASGASGFVMEVVGLLLPVATGGLTPLAALPQPLRIFALSTPFSYSAELIRYSLLGAPTALEPGELAVRGATYSALFILTAIAYFRHQMRKIRREGTRATALW